MFVIMNFMYVKVFASILLIFMITNDGCVNSHDVLEQPDVLVPKKIKEEKPYIFHPDNNKLEVDEGDGFRISFEEVSNKTQFVYCYYESASMKGNYLINRQFEDAITTTYRPYPYNQDHLLAPEVENVDQLLGQDIQRDKRIPHKKKNRSDKNKSKPQTANDDEDEEEDEEKEFEVPQVRREPNTLKTDSTTCGLVVGNVNSRIPRFWTLTAFDAYSQRNFTENVTIYFYYNAPIAFKKIHAMSGSSYFNYLKLDPKVQIKNCILSHDQMAFDLDLYDNTLESEYDLQWKVLGDGRCGFVVRDAKLNNPSNLTLRVIAKDKRSFRNTSLIEVLDESVFFRNHEIFTMPTESIDVHCGMPFEPSRLASPERFCILFDPHGNLVQAGDSCSYFIEHVTREDFGIWSCIIGPGFSMDTLTFNTTVSHYGLSKDLEVETYMTDHGKYFSLTCEMINFKSNETFFCRFTRPDGELFTTYSGAASSEGYLTYSTNLHEGICGIDIPKPSQFVDKGTWRCEIFTLAFKTGGFIDFVHPSPPVLLQEMPPRPVAVGGSFVVKCAVGFSASSCYIVSPNGTHFESEEHYAWFAGECGIKIRKASASDNGIWTCFFARDSTSLDHRVHVNITVADTAKDLNAEIKLTTFEKFNITCFTSDIPLDYCRLFSPSGHGYSFNGTRTTEKHSDITLRYIGEGLEFGDCIIEIGNATESKAGGTWTCSFKLRNIRSTFTHTYTVVVQYDDHNIILLIFFGIFIAFIFNFASYVYKFYQKRCSPREYERRRQERRLSSFASPESGRSNRGTRPLLGTHLSSISQSLDTATVPPENIVLQELSAEVLPSSQSPQPGPSTRMPEHSSTNQEEAPDSPNLINLSAESKC